MNPPANIDVVKLVYEEMQKWKAAPSDVQARLYMTELADRLIDFFHFHYTPPVAQPTVLPGLPGGER